MGRVLLAISAQVFRIGVILNAVGEALRTEPGEQTASYTGIQEVDAQIGSMAEKN